MKEFWVLLIACGIGTLICQITKFLLTVVKKKTDYKMLVNAGGMPSSHSASMVVLSLLLYLINGLSLLTAMAIVLMFVIFSDAYNYRHKLSEIFVGILIGVVIALVTWGVFL